MVDIKPVETKKFTNSSWVALIFYKISKRATDAKNFLGMKFDDRGYSTSVYTAYVHGNNEIEYLSNLVDKLRKLTENKRLIVGTRREHSVVDIKVVKFE